MGLMIQQEIDMALLFDGSHMLGISRRGGG